MTGSLLNPEQEAALATRDVSIALSAGAGCGKTHVLTERFLSHVEPSRKRGESEPAGLHQLLAITFTDASAREMRTRIRQACRERLRNPKLDAATIDDYLHLLRSIDTARISTIHSFCTSLLRKYAVDAGLDPGFGVLAQGEADVLASEVIDDVLRQLLSDRDELTLELAATFGLRRLKDNLLLLAENRVGVDETSWQEQTPEHLVERWRNDYHHRARPAALQAIAADQAVEQIQQLLIAVSPNRPSFVAAKANLLELLPKLTAGNMDDEQLAELREQAKVQAICSAKDWPEKALYERYSQACKSLRDAIDRHSLPPFRPEAALEVARLGIGLFHLSLAIDAEYSQRKAALGKLDFDDQLKKAHALLTSPHHTELRDQLSADLAIVLVDEFQDTDQLQADLIESLCGKDLQNGRLFVVGDFKQSIYRFRGARPEVFRNLEQQMKEPGRLKLTENFRSQPAILDFVNALFYDAFGQDFVPLRAHREQVTAPPCVEFLWAPAPGKNAKLKGAAGDARKEEADWIARRLRQIIDRPAVERLVVDRTSGQPRAVELGDIAILFRALSDVQVYEEALRRYDLPYYLVGGHAYYAQQEIFDVLNLLRAVASTADEIALAGVLRSPFFALEDETLYWLVEQGAGGREQGDGQRTRAIGRLNDGLFGVPPAELSEVERAKVTRAAETIGYLRSIKDRVPIARLLQEALARTGYDAVLLAEFLGRRKLANLQKLLEQARAADAGGTLSLDGFITQLAQFIAQQPKEALAATAAETADVIRLMTIHQAKGLQFPLVVVPDLDRPPRLSAPSAAIDRDLGPVVALPSDDDRQDSVTGMTLFAARERQSELDERTRLLYVAFTRAADHLILSSSVESCEAPNSDWMRLLAGRFDLATGALLGDLPVGYERPQVRVSLDKPETDFSPIGSPRGAKLLDILAAARNAPASGGSAVIKDVTAVPPDRAARRQFSFSRLTGKLVRKERYVEAETETAATNRVNETEDEEIQNKHTGGIQFGSLVHNVLQRLDFAQELDPSSIRQWCEHLAPLYVHQEPADVAEAADLAGRMIERFAASPRGKELSRATSLRREVEFLLGWTDDRYLHGYIDALVKSDDGAWRIIDYKTNEVSQAAIKRVASKYELQLYVYALAVERALGVAPAELVLYFLRPAEEYVFPWNDAARNNVHQMVNDALDEYQVLTSD